MQLLWTRKVRVAEGPAHIARVRQYHLEEHHQQPGSVASVFCFGLMMLMLIAMWENHIRGAVMGHN